MKRSYVSATVIFGAFGLVVLACSAPDRFVIATRPEEPSAPGFTNGDSGPDLDGGSTPLVEMCPTNECPPGYAMCLGTEFPCTDLRTDNYNCGACGNRCPAIDAFAFEHFKASSTCIDGVCRLECEGSYGDCNVLPDDGCEVFLPSDNQNCGACGNACPEQYKCLGSKCVCADDLSCGACGNRCPENTNPAFPVEWNATYGCVEGECNRPQCKQFFGDCNNDFPGNFPHSTEGDGCESILSTLENCGACGNACAEGEECRSFKCICPCGSVCDHHSFENDPLNCGACGIRCEIPYDEHSSAVCDHGVCDQRCEANWGDCDGNSLNGCETDLLRNPRHCGGCGAHCDGADGQACVDGQCTMKECIIR